MRTANEMVRAYAAGSETGSTSWTYLWDALPS